ncbi:ARL14 effector protein-like isoform X1 [Uloborus diversus]|uniref:ARL14 effector protein-like isoform X1 n=1 Tax=Uloborus diversus TaxID=327109 RepID=UPI0024099853|nr:ARL14 effector protein-like isoform X1 [Uloborus diversus]
MELRRNSKISNDDDSSNSSKSLRSRKKESNDNKEAIVLTSESESSSDSSSIALPPKKRKYDENGIHISTGKDMCDCLNLKCSGCWMPCKNCNSQKCGFRCRENRTSECVGYEIEGKEDKVKNPLLK